MYEALSGPCATSLGGLELPAGWSWKLLVYEALSLTLLAMTLGRYSGRFTTLLLLYCLTTNYSVYVSAGVADAVVSGEAVALLIFARVGLVFLLLHFQLHPAGSLRPHTRPTVGSHTLVA